MHREFCELATCADGVVRSAGRVKTTPEAPEVLAASLEPTDRVAMEVSGGSWEVARILEPHVQRVIVVSPDDTGIAQARTKTDKLNARALAKLLWQSDLDAVWMPDKRCRGYCAGGRRAASSFVTAYEVPGDFDGCWDITGVDPDVLDPVLLTFENGRAAQKPRFGGEFFPAQWEPDEVGTVYLDYFRRPPSAQRLPQGFRGIDPRRVLEAVTSAEPERADDERPRSRVGVLA